VLCIALAGTINRKPAPGLLYAWQSCTHHRLASPQAHSSITRDDNLCNYCTNKLRHGNESTERRYYWSVLVFSWCFTDTMFDFLFYCLHFVANVIGLRLCILGLHGAI